MWVFALRRKEVAFNTLCLQEMVKLFQSSAVSGLFIKHTLIKLPRSHLHELDNQVCCSQILRDLERALRMNGVGTTEI